MPFSYMEKLAPPISLRTFKGHSGNCRKSAHEVNLKESGWGGGRDHILHRDSPCSAFFSIFVYCDYLHYCMLKCWNTAVNINCNINIFCVWSLFWRHFRSPPKHFTYELKCTLTLVCVFCVIDVEELTLLVADGNRQESDEGHDCYQREEDPDDEEELEALKPGPPVVLQVHDVSDQGPKSQHTWGTNTTDTFHKTKSHCFDLITTNWYKMSLHSKHF